MPWQGILKCEMISNVLVFFNLALELPNYCTTRKDQTALLNSVIYGMSIMPINKHDVFLCVGNIRDALHVYFSFSTPLFLLPCGECITNYHLEYIRGMVCCISVLLICICVFVVVLRVHALQWV